VVFTSTQRDADILADRLADMGHAVAALHGGMPQGRRNRVLQALRSRQLRVLVATDVAARGIDVPTITHVINYGMPMKAEDYVHRIGRTGRAGRSGLAVTLAERRDIPMVRRIERFTTQRIPESAIAGLEPKTKMMADKGGPRRDKPMPGYGRRDDRAPRFGGDRGGFGGDRGGDRGGFGGQREGGWGEPRGFTPREERPSFKPNQDPRFEGHGRPSEDRGFAPREDRGFGAPRFDDRGPAKSFGDKPFGKPAGKSFGGKPGFGDRPFGDRPQGDRPFGDKPFGGKGGKPFGDRSFGDKPFGDKSFGGKPAGKSFGGKPSFGDRPAFGDKPFGDKPSFGGKPGFKSGGPKPGFGGKRPGFGKREG